MVNRVQSEQNENQQRVKIGQLKLNKETIQELTSGETKLIRGGEANLNRGGKCHSTYIVGGVNPKGGNTLT